MIDLQKYFNLQQLLMNRRQIERNLGSNNEENVKIFKVHCLATCQKVLIELTTSSGDADLYVKSGDSSSSLHICANHLKGVARTAVAISTKRHF